MRRVGVLIPLAADDPQSQRRMTAFVQGLQELGWTDGRNIRIDTRWTAGDTDRMRRHAAELVALAPDVMWASGGTVVGALLTTRKLRAYSVRAPARTRRLRGRFLDLKDVAAAQPHRCAINRC